MIWNRPARRRKSGIKAMQMSSDVMKLKKRSLVIVALSDGEAEVKVETIGNKS
jgi:hypothetical protein